MNYQKITFLFLFLSFSLSAQIKQDSTANDSLKNTSKKGFFSDKDLSLIDSLVIETRYKSPLTANINYVIKGLEAKEKPTKKIPTSLLKERLKQLDNSSPFFIEYNPILENVINSYLKYRKKYYPALMAKAEYYFPMFEKYLDQFDIPLEMKYLAIVESALNPRARSRVGAKGLWQFMYLTGKQYKLNVNSYVDERQDPIKATIAACKYLSDLYDIFGDWDLALAAYNSGPGNVSKAIKRSGGYQNYWNLRQYLPRETAGYVPAFYATLYIFKYAKEHGLAPENPPIYHFATDTIQIKKTVSFDQITEVTGIETEMLQFLNPEYKLDIIPFVKNKKYSVTIPRNATIKFLEKEKELYALVDEDNAKREKPLPKYLELNQRLRYKVRSGDYLGKIAKKFGVRVSQIKKWNRLRSTNLKIGQRLTIFPRRL
ncbi:Membrane-bound lytic murein transglycosylase D [Polaribacter huanghezhanensis]|uniref:lytic transglycosylase domain-containing protein n=1 Tax=Polaribacter huanghezhanensis TaxID=1354726 RepID=UPI002649FAB4|nr:lytic transglycosylase domain-containing protein [Polaribacter huanghezhanensis]WKD85456.1 Membrane-bound lytic murein transglycosylase D [Polaribacter huanghezhanensis]